MESMQSQWLSLWMEMGAGRMLGRPGERGGMSRNWLERYVAISSLHGSDLKLHYHQKDYRFSTIAEEIGFVKLFLFFFFFLTRVEYRVIPPGLLICADMIAGISFVFYGC